MDFCFDVKGNSPRVSNHNVLVGGGGIYTSSFVSLKYDKKMYDLYENIDCEKN